MCRQEYSIGRELCAKHKRYCGIVWNACVVVLCKKTTVRSPH